MSDLLYKYRWRILTLLMLSTFPSTVSVSMINAILPTITIEFQTDISVAQWIPGLHRLMITSLLLIYGRMGDKYGHIRLFMVGMISWILFTVIVGLSQNIHQLIFFRALQGAAQGMRLAMPLAIITSAFPPQERGRALGLYAGSVALGTSLGPIIGGVITELYGWRSIFFMVAGASLVVLLWGLSWIPRGKTTTAIKLDSAGATGVFVFLFSLVLLVGQGRAWGWTSPASLSVLGVTILAGLTLIWIEGRATNPLLALDLFSNLTLSLGTLSASFNFMARYMVMFVIPFYFQFVLGLSLSKLGMLVAVIPIVNMVVSPLSGILSDRIGSKPLILTGTILCTLVLISMTSLDASSSIADIIWRLALFGLGAASFHIPIRSSVMSSIGKGDLGIASGILSLGRNMGWSLGIAVAGSVLYGQTLDQYSLEQSSHLLSSIRISFIVATALSAASVVTAFLASVRYKERLSTD